MKSIAPAVPKPKQNRRPAAARFKPIIRDATQILLAVLRIIEDAAGGEPPPE
jgi:hypothetical protein